MINIDDRIAGFNPSEYYTPSRRLYEVSADEIKDLIREVLAEVKPKRESDDLITANLQQGKPQLAASRLGKNAAITEMEANIEYLLNPAPDTKE